MTEQNTSPHFPTQNNQSNNQLCKERYPNLLYLSVTVVQVSIYYLKELQSLVSTKVDELE